MWWGPAITARALSPRELALGPRTLGPYGSPLLKACDLGPGASPLRASVSPSKMGLRIGQSCVVLCADWGWCPAPDLSCPHGPWVKPHIPSSGFRLQDSKFSVPSSEKIRPQTGRGERAWGSRGAGGGEATGAARPILISGPLLLFWAIVTQRLEATPESRRTLWEGLAQWQCHLFREVGMLGCPGTPLPRPPPRLPKRRPEISLLLCRSLSAECAACAHSSEMPRGPVRAQLCRWLWSCLHSFLQSDRARTGLPPRELAWELRGFHGDGWWIQALLPFRTHSVAQAEEP